MAFKNIEKGQAFARPTSGVLAKQKKERCARNGVKSFAVQLTRPNTASEPDQHGSFEHMHSEFDFPPLPAHLSEPDTPRETPSESRCGGPMREIVVYTKALHVENETAFRFLCGRGHISLCCVRFGRLSFSTH